ncbi:MAG: glycoside hydrolase family 15 protein [Bacteroidetes bacterium]|jgi:GH15 family glucan-1,4-alpha-glucosidase|nr:glycoside hydrolase family 15 protein [Bacteroidota bacterium]
MPDESYLPIADYGLIGNLHTVALVSKQGSIDYLPFTRFDSPTLFASLLDHEKGGKFQLCPKDGNIRIKQLYLPDTAVLLTRFLSDTGMVELTDFMPVKEQEEGCSLVRTLRCIRGNIPFEVSCEPRFHYGAEGAGFEAENEYSVLMQGEEAELSVRLRSEVPLHTVNGEVRTAFDLEEGDCISFVMEAVADPAAQTDREMAYYAETLFDETLHFWENWMEQITYQGRWLEHIRRSAITLKLLTSYRYGSTVAAATFGLPEQIGGERNWDYRYCWIRDSAFSMYAFLRLGFREEAQAFMRWIIDRCKELDHAGNLRLMYRVDGSADLEERSLTHLSGYRDSQPVRVGNAAVHQYQLDIFGELIDTVYLYNRYDDSITFEFWQELREIIDYVADNWQRKGHGIWEVRSAEQEFLHSKLMCWVALDRGVRIAANRSFPAPIAHWRKVRDEIYEDIYHNFWSEEKQAFTQARGSDVLDASALLIPIVRLLSPHEKRWQSTLRAIEEELVTDTLVYRYHTAKGAEDGLEGTEGTFSLCSFWYIENLAKAGQLSKARLYFEKMLGYANHLGLYSEMIALNGEQVGNFPQAFTHLSLISAALQLDYMLDNGVQ